MGAAHTKCNREGIAYEGPEIETKKRVTTATLGCRSLENKDFTVFCTHTNSEDRAALARRRLSCVHRIDGYNVISLFHFCDFDEDGLMYPPPCQPK
jgi:hypothetical protein